MAHWRGHRDATGSPAVDLQRRRRRFVGDPDAHLRRRRRHERLAGLSGVRMMEEILRFAVLGLGTGALYALAAQGLVVTYRSSGVVNFA